MSRPLSRDDKRLRTSVLFAVAVHSLFILFFTVFLFQHANPMGDGMEMVGSSIAFIVAAVLTPPDPLSQISLALPTIALYELSIYAVKLAEKRHAASTTSAKPAAKPAGKPA